MPRPKKFPHKVKDGPLKGQVFETQDDLDQAYRDLGIEPPKTTRKSADEKPRVARAGNGVTRAMAEGLVSAANVILAIVPQTREDTLDETEQRALVNAILATASANKHFAAIIIRVCSVSGSAQLATTVGSLVAVRLAKRGLIPFEMGYFGTMVIEMQAQGSVPTQQPEPPKEPDDNVISFSA